MAKISILSTKGETVGEMELNNVFSYPVKETLITEIVLQELANKRAGCASTKTRGEVRGGGRKPWPQKHTGRARQGSIRAPQWRKGGVVFGPKPRDYSYTMPRVKKTLGLISVLSQKFKENKIVVVDNFTLDEYKTKKFVEVLENLDVLGTAIVVLDNNDENIIRSGRNVSGIKLLSPSQLTVYDLLKYEKLVITKNALQLLQDRLMKQLKIENEK
jgi:large subunit ribosomal protein L4